MSVTNLYNVHLPQILYSNDAPASLMVRFFIITHDMLLMHSNMLIRIAILSIMRNGTIYIFRYKISLIEYLTLSQITFNVLTYIEISFKHGYNAFTYETNIFVTVALHMFTFVSFNRTEIFFWCQFIAYVL